MAARWALSLLNVTLRARRLAYIHLALRGRRIRSRIRYAQSRRGLPAQPSKIRTLSLLCPTRARVRNLRTFIRSVCATAAVPERVEILFYIDEDDPDRESYIRYFKASARAHNSLLRCAPIIGPPIGISKAWTVLARHTTADLLLMANDDQFYVDYGWDTEVDRACDAYPDDIVCLYFDGRKREKIIEGLPKGDFPIVTRKWFDIVGHFTPGIFKFWCNELWILDIAERIGRSHPIPGVFVDHLHYDAYKSPFDETYRRPHVSGDKSNRDRELYAETAIERMKAAVKLNRAIRAAAGVATATPANVE